AKLPALAESIDTFAAGSGAIRQLVVSGPPASGRTTLALAIGGEATTRRRKVRYLSATRLAEKTAYAWERASDVEQPWQVGEAELVIVDEIPVAMFAGPDIAAALGALVDCDWNSNRTSVFERPVGACVPQPDGSFPPPAGAVREMPQVVWVVDDQALADRLAAAIAARFPGAPLLHVRLARAIGSTRVMRAEG
ncbi:MAG: hypothetical protein FJX53_10270, partial [Alphaproteobacteria bacterium]|nr:hypothetical protein [Alphaproteobacteria bacterium]